MYCKYVSVTFVLCKICRKQHEVEEQESQGFRLWVTCRQVFYLWNIYIPLPPSIIPSEKNSLHSSSAVHQPLPPGRGDLSYFLLFSSHVSKKLQCRFAFSLPAFNFLWVADVCWLSRRATLMSIWCQLGLSWVGVLSTGTLKLLGKSTEKSGRLKSLQHPPQKLTAERLVVN